jgi:hypothetical protein
MEMEDYPHPWDGVWNAKDALVKDLKSKFIEDKDTELIASLGVSFVEYEKQKHTIYDLDLADELTEELVNVVDETFVKEKGLLNVAKDMKGRCKATVDRYFAEVLKMKTCELDFFEIEYLKCNATEKKRAIKMIMSRLCTEVTFYGKDWLVQTDVPLDECKYLILFVESLIA